MSAPRGKVTRFDGAQAPWNTADALHPSKPDKGENRSFKYTPQEEIDFCINCTEYRCTGDCEKLQLFKYDQIHKQSEYKKYSSIPAGARDDFLNGMTQVQIARKYKVAEITVFNWKKKLGLPPGRITPEFDIAKFEKLAREGTPLCDMIKIFGIGVKRAKKLYEELDIPIPPNYRDMTPEQRKSRRAKK